MMSKGTDRNLKIINNIFENILKHPNETKYRKLNMRRIMSKIGNDTSYIQWLYNAGFYDTHNGKRLSFDVDKISQLKNIRDMLQEILYSSHKALNANDSDSTNDLFDLASCPSNYLCVKCKKVGDHWIMNCPIRKIYMDAKGNLKCLDRHSMRSYLEISATTSRRVHCKDIEHCFPITRLLTSLLFYNHLEINNVNDQLSFCNFMDTIYKHYVYDDFYHFTKHHQNEIESIMDLAIKSYKMTKCDSLTCDYSNRHFRVYRIDNEHKEDIKYWSLYKETMDSLHFYIFHLIECGYRLSGNNRIAQCCDEDTMKESISDFSSSYDPDFSGVISRINKTRDKTDRFPRMTLNKYDVAVANNIDSTEGDSTYLDAICFDVGDELNDETLSDLLEDVLESNGYDTDSLDLDMAIFFSDGKSNVSLLVNNIQIMRKLEEIFEEIKSYVICA